MSSRTLTRSVVVAAVAALLVPLVALGGYGRGKSASVALGK